MDPTSGSSGQQQDITEVCSKGTHGMQKLARLGLIGFKTETEIKENTGLVQGFITELKQLG